MSWIFGYSGKFKISPPVVPVYAFNSEGFSLYGGGNPKTLFFESDIQNNSGWIVAGVGLKRTNHGYKLLRLNDWKNELTPDYFHPSALNGHFVIIKFKPGGLEIFTDRLGLREIYLVKLQGGFGFTTRIDWVKHFAKPEPDIEQIGARWLLYNQISGKSLLRNVIRVVRSSARLKGNEITISEDLWRGNREVPASNKYFESLLEQFAAPHGEKISLSLSGGIDSRLLLSFLLKRNFNEWDSHTFGDASHPDAVVPTRLAEELGFKHNVLDDRLPSEIETVKMIKEYSVRSIITNPVSAILNLRFYNRIIADPVIIDGGFGEIWRQQFANRLRTFGHSAVKKKNAIKIFSLLKNNKADVFAKEVEDLMFNGAVAQIENILDELPSPEETDLSNWIELFSIRTRLPNYYGPEQARVDQYAVSYMPLAQLDLLNLLPSLKISEKKNGRLFKALIKQNSPALSRFPLVKGTAVHPFNLSSLSIRFYSGIKSGFGPVYINKQKAGLFNLIKDFVPDLLNSNEVRNCELYDRKKLTGISESFSRNQMNLSDVDWWLSFELFRQGVIK